MRLVLGVLLLLALIVGAVLAGTVVAVVRLAAESRRQALSHRLAYARATWPRRPWEEDLEDQSGCGALDAESAKRLYAAIRVRHVPGGSASEIARNLLESCGLLREVRA